MKKNKVYFFALAFFWLVFYPGLLPAQNETLLINQGTATSLSEVLESVQRHYPLIKAARAEIISKDAMVQAAQGAFDPVLDGAIKNRLNGYYDGNSLETTYSKRIPAFGTKIFAGFKRSSGDFPVYENNLVTTNDGESRIGMSFSLWRDRDIDEFRYETASTRMDAMSERYQLQQDIIGILQETYIAYAQWLQAARLLDDYSALLEIAEDRAAAVQRSVESGNEAEILAVDNELAVLQRRGLVVDARRLLDSSAFKLSLYLRNQDGTPRLPVYQNTLSMPEENIAGSNDIERILDRAIELNPVIARTRLAREQQQLDIRLAENQAKPRVDFRLYNSRDFGSGLSALQGPENVVDINFSIPLATNSARGKARAARSRITGLDYRLRQYTNQTRTNLEVALVNLDATREMENIAVQELEAAQRLAEAEARRFETGLSDFFQLNQREQYVAQAELKRWRSHFEHQVALANYYGVSMNFEALGLNQLVLE